MIDVRDELREVLKVLEEPMIELATKHGWEIHIAFNIRLEDEKGFTRTEEIKSYLYFKKKEDEIKEVKVNE